MSPTEDDKIRNIANVYPTKQEYISTQRIEMLHEVKALNDKDFEVSLRKTPSIAKSVASNKEG